MEHRKYYKKLLIFPLLKFKIRGFLFFKIKWICWKDEQVWMGLFDTRTHLDLLIIFYAFRFKSLINSFKNDGRTQFKGWTKNSKHKPATFTSFCFGPIFHFWLLKHNEIKVFRQNAPQDQVINLGCILSGAW